MIKKTEITYNEASSLMELYLELTQIIVEKPECSVKQIILDPSAATHRRKAIVIWDIENSS